MTCSGNDNVQAMSLLSSAKTLYFQSCDSLLLLIAMSLLVNLLILFQFFNKWGKMIKMIRVSSKASLNIFVHNPKIFTLIVE